ncbi:MAG: HAD hydrolase-like protein [Clostridia bacterium]|nr:HAD hydrolase-like protein [Clostridia bacterium]
MKKYKCLFFDLDGTLTDSSEGIINSIIYALEKMNVDIKDKAILKKFVGPPLMDSYKKYYGFNQEEAELGLKLFREYFSVKGIFENRLFDGIYDLLEQLYNAGVELVLATSKPDVYAEQILEHFGIKKFFTHISACPMEEADTTKLDIIKGALKMTSVKNKEEILMIGDTFLDVNGAKECGLDSIGVLYGTDGPEELKVATYIAKDVEELKNILIK